MNYNNYPYGYGYPQYNYQMQEPQNNIVFKYGTRREAEPYAVMPMQTAIFLNRTDNEIYVKSADNMGISAFKVYKQVLVSDNPTDTQKPVLDPKEFVSRQEFDDILAKLKELEAKVVGHD